MKTDANVSKKKKTGSERSTILIIRDSQKGNQLKSDSFFCSLMNRVGPVEWDNIIICESLNEGFNGFRSG